MKKFSLPISFIAGLIFFLLAPALVFAWDGNYSYISTETGTQVSHVYRHEYKIVDKKTHFSTEDLIFALTKIKNIYGVDSFRFKYELYYSNNRRQTEYSNVFYPNGQRWPEIISSWNAFDNLPDGRYELKVYIQIDNSSYKYLDSKRFDVGNYNDDYDYNWGYYDNNYGYNYSWTKTGTYIRKTSSYSYEVAGPKTEFREDENIRVLTKLNNIRHIDYFRVKHEVYLEGGRFYKKAESSIEWPRYNYWEYNYALADFGKLPRGNNEIRVYISINGGPYKHIGKKSIRVGRGYYNDFDYSYNWSKTDTNIKYIGHYKYDLVHEKSTFYTDENVIALTKLSGIRGVDTFRVKQELLKDAVNVYKTRESTLRTPRYNYWEYNYTEADFGKVPAGNHKIKAYISVNGGGYRYLGSTNITVRERYTQSNYQNNYCPNCYGSYYSMIPSYNYDWTKTGTNNQPYFYPYYYN